MRWKFLFWCALVLCLIVPTASTSVYRLGVRQVAGDCLLEAARMGLVDFGRATDWYLALVRDSRSAESTDD